MVIIKGHGPAGYNSQVVGWENILTVEAFLPLCFALAAVLLIWLYNGRRGKDVKWAFYASYPVHIAILAVRNEFITQCILYAMEHIQQEPD